MAPEDPWVVPWAGTRVALRVVLEALWVVLEDQWAAQEARWEDLPVGPNKVGPTVVHQARGPS